MVINQFNIQFNNRTAQMHSQPHSRLKIDFIVIGNQNCGKTSLIKRFIKGQDSFSHFYTPTVGLNLDKKVVRLDDHRQVTVCIWDTAGQEKFFALTKNYFKKADGVLIVFDITDKSSFERIEQYWLDQVKEKSDTASVRILVGNKVDMLEERQVKFVEAKQLADRHGLQYFQTSARTGEQVENAFMYLTRQCAERIKDSEPEEHVVTIVERKEEHKEKGCFSGIKNLFKRHK